MRTDLPSLEHALYGGQDVGGYRFLARSAGFAEEWLPEAEHLCTGFGERPAGVACPRAVFARPFGKKHVAVVQAADQGMDDQGRPGALAFHVVVLPAELYFALGGDPFYIADRVAPPWAERGILSPLPCPEPEPPRRVEDVQRVIKEPFSSVLLGGVQALLDGGRLAFERPEPDGALMRGLWTLLPTSSRADMWPASFAFGNALGFHAVVLPRIIPEQCPQYLSEEQAAEYPEGRYELALHTAADHGDQDTIDGLFARRSYREVRRIAFMLLGLVVVFVGVNAVLNRVQRPPAKQTFELPPPEGFRDMTPRERDDFLRKLRGLMAREGVPPPWQVRDVVLLAGNATPWHGPGALGAAGFLGAGPMYRASPEELVLALDRHLGTPDPQRNPGPLDDEGPAKRQFRIVMWKHGLESYRDPQLTPAELVAHLQEALQQRKDGIRP